MLAIRMQRTGRHGHAMFRMVVQDSRRTPTSGNIVASLGHYDPHTKIATFDKEKAAFYLEHGAQPSDRVTYLLKSQGVKLPSWVKLDTKKSSEIRHQEKLRRNRPAVPKEAVIETPVKEETAAEIVEPVASEPKVETTVENVPAEPTEPIVSVPSNDAENETSSRETTPEVESSESQTK